MTMQQILTSLKNKEFKPVYFFYGNESYYIDKLIDYIEHHILNEGEKAFNQIVLYGKEINAQQIVDNAVQFPMMSAYRLIIVKEAQDLKDIKLLADYFAKPAPTTILVLAYKKEKVDKRVNWWKNLQKNGVTFESKALYQNKIPGFINSTVTANKRKISGQAAMLLSEYLGTDLSKIHNELDKLYLVIPENEEITLQAIQDQVGISKEYNIFEFQSALGLKNHAKIFRICQYFEKNPKSHPLVLTIGSLYRYYTKIWIAQQNMQLPDNVLMKKLGLFNAFFVKEYKAAAQKYNGQQLERALKLLNEFDLKSKGVNIRSGRENSLLSELVVQLIA